jgi:NitT/TauT family transport system ATP-binding protein
MLDALGLSLAYGEREILRDLELKVAAGESSASSVLRAAARRRCCACWPGLTLPTSGEVRFKGRRVDAPQPGIAIVFQDYGRALLPWRTVFGNVALAFEARGLDKGAAGTHRRAARQDAARRAC